MATCKAVVLFCSTSSPAICLLSWSGHFVHEFSGDAFALLAATSRYLRLYAYPTQTRKFFNSTSSETQHVVCCVAGAIAWDLTSERNCKFPKQRATFRTIEHHKQKCKHRCQAPLRWLYCSIVMVFTLPSMALCVECRAWFR